MNYKEQLNQQQFSTIKETNLIALLWRWRNFLLAQLRVSNLVDCSNSPQNQQSSDHLQHATANAIAKNDLDRLDKSSFNSSPINKNKQLNYNTYKKFLCDYNYQGKKWSIEIYAVSFEDAEARLTSIKYGQITGQVELEIPIPPKSVWFKTWITRMIELFK